MKLNKKQLADAAAKGPVRRSLNETQARELRAEGLVVIELGGSEYEVSSRDGSKWDITHTVQTVHREVGAFKRRETIEVVNPDEIPHERLINNPFANLVLPNK